MYISFPKQQNTKAPLYKTKIKLSGIKDYDLDMGNFFLFLEINGILIV